MKIFLFLGILLNPFLVNAFHLKVDSQGHLAWADNGQRFIIKESNSPENRLKWMDKNELNVLASYGVNTIYASLFGGDDRSVHPFINRSNPAQGFDQNKINAWRDYFQHWINLGGGRNVIHILLSENENHRELNDVNHRAYIDAMVASFGDLPVIWDREEVRESAAWIRTWNGYLKQKDPVNIVGIHNWPNETPWRDLVGSGLIDLLSFQGSVDQAPGVLANWHQQALNSGKPWAVYASEITPYDINLAGQVATCKRWFEAASNVSSGAGIYYGSKDQSFPNHQPFESCYTVMTRPSLETVLGTRSDLYWVNSGKIGNFAEPSFTTPWKIVAPNNETFGFWETRESLAPMAAGWYRLRFKNKSNGILRLRVFETDFNRVDDSVFNANPNPDSFQEMSFYLSGQKRWKIAIDMIPSGPGWGNTVDVSDLSVARVPAVTEFED